MEKIKVSIVSYSNTIPFLYGLKSSDLYNEIDLSYDIPSVCAEKLNHREVDISLLPVAAVRNFKIITDYCLGGYGKIKSVLLLGNNNIKQIKKIYLDYHSRTSALLTKILSKNLWKIQPEFIDTSPGFENKQYSKDEAILLIGNRALMYSEKYMLRLDLAEQWFQLTSLPFVFAVWATNKQIPDSFIHSFSAALKFGTEHIDRAVKEIPSPLSEKLLYDYLSNDISFFFDQKKKEAMKLYFNYASKI